jgi:hypothetical protein
MKQSSGFVRQGTGKKMTEDMSQRLREAEKFVRPELKDKEIDERRKFLNALFFGETTPELMPLATSVRPLLLPSSFVLSRPNSHSGNSENHS